VSAWPRVRSIRRILHALMTATLVAGAVVAAAPAASADECLTVDSSLAKAPVLRDDLSPAGAPVRETTMRDGTSIPVIVVHGWTGRSVHDDGRTGAFSSRIDLTANKVGEIDVPRSLIGAIQDLGGTSVYTFDYHDASSRWVTDQAIAPKLARAIGCLSAQHEHPAVVVAHSMGGLATRLALTQLGTDAGEAVSDVITFGTPNTGSWLASVVGAADAGARIAGLFPGVAPKVVTAVRSILVACGTATTNSMTDSGACGMLPAQLASARSQAGRALQVGSREIRALPAWPSGVQVHALAGAIDLEIVRTNWFRASTEVGGINAGDFVVGEGSASVGTAARSLTCNYTLDVGSATSDNILQAFRLRSANETRDNVYTSLGSSACFHGNLMRSIELTNETIGVIADRVDAADPAPSLAGLPPEYEGEWCTRSGSDCLSFAELKDEYPEAFVGNAYPAEDGGTGQLVLCLLNDLDDGCTTAATMYLEYFPPGVGWDCLRAAEEIGLPGCEEDFTAAHDTSLPRLVVRPNHQQGDLYWDVEPMYRR
jgi:pimeloyl-ACP methyl ester carboxylesterase